MQRCLISEVPSPLVVYTSFKEHSYRVHSLTYPTEKLVETVGTAVTVLENAMSKVVHSEGAELHMTNSMKKGIYCD